jgi:hypothetical protein
MGIRSALRLDWDIDRWCCEVARVVDDARRSCPNPPFGSCGMGGGSSFEGWLCEGRLNERIGLSVGGACGCTRGWRGVIGERWLCKGVSDAATDEMSRVLRLRATDVDNCSVGNGGAESGVV